MKFKAPLSLLALCLLSQISNAQQTAVMSASTGLAPGNSFTLFVNFQDPMPKITAFQCNFTLVGTPQPGQENFARAVNCIGEPKKIDDTDYISQVGIPASGIAGGDYKISSIDLYVGQAHSHYDGDSLPVLAPVRISNSEHLKFSPIKKLEIRP